MIDDGFTEAALDGARGRDRVEEALSEALAAGVLERARGRYRFRHAFVREELAARLPEEALRRAHADAAALLATDGCASGAGRPSPSAAPAVRGRPSRSSPRPPSGPWAWAPTATVPTWAELALEHAHEYERPGLLALRAQLLHGAGEAHAPAAYAAGDRGRAAERVPALRVQQARACLAAGDIEGAKAALEAGARPSGPRTSVSRSCARHGRVAHRRLGGCTPGGRRGGTRRCRSGRARRS